jgi:cell shape-determining protein MreC
MRWYYDLDINIEGIEALNYLLEKVKSLQEEIQQLKNELRFYKSLFP